MDGRPDLLRRSAAERIGAFALTRHFPRREAATYVGAQLLGAIAYQLVRGAHPRSRLGTDTDRNLDHTPV